MAPLSLLYYSEGAESLAANIKCDYACYARGLTLGHSTVVRAVLGTLCMSTSITKPCQCAAHRMLCRDCKTALRLVELETVELVGELEAGPVPPC